MGKRPELVSGNKEVIASAFGRKDGGAIPAPKKPFKKGGKVELKEGGKVVAPKFKEGGKVEGRASGGRLDKPGRFASGGRTGCEANPFSGAKID